MGYTHYFPQKRAFTSTEWDGITKAVNRVIHKAPLAGPRGDGKPRVNEDEIAFNGRSADDDDYESFWITRDHNTDFNFCKTAQRPYDQHVVATLVVCATLAPGALKISSDGNKEDWHEGFSLAQHVLSLTHNLKAEDVVHPLASKED